jgi:hypothetical protein
MIEDYMKKINDIFINSLIPNKKFYKSLLKKNLIFSFNYFLLFIFVINTFFIISLTLKLNLPANYQNFKQLLNRFDEIPNSLIINIENSHLSTTHNRPLLIWINNNGDKDLLAVLDETADAEKINIYDTPILLTASEIVFKNNSTNYSSVDYPKESIKITKENIVNVKNYVIKFLPFIVGSILFYFVAVSPLILFLTGLISLALISLPIFIIFSLKNKKIKFQKVFQISLHASTIPIIIFTILPLLDNVFLTLISFPLFIILEILFISVSLYDAYS